VLSLERESDCDFIVVELIFERLHVTRSCPRLGASFLAELTGKVSRWLSTQVMLDFPVTTNDLKVPKLHYF